MSNKVIFQGYYGMQNSGDDAFIEVAAWGANNIWNASKTTFLTPNSIKLNNPCNFLAPPKFKGHTYLQELGKLCQSSHFISAGGSTFQNSLPLKSIKRNALFKKKINPSYTVGAIGVSIGPYKSISDEEYTKNHLRQLDFLAVRDNKSFEIAQSYNLPYKPVHAFDLAALLPEIYKNNSIEKGIKSNTGKNVVGISLCNYESYIKGGNTLNEKRRNDKIFEFLVQLGRLENIKFRFFIFNGNSKIGDANLTEHVVYKLEQVGITDSEIVPYLGNVHETWSLIQQCDLMFSTRLHASIFACYAGIPFFLVEYHRKCSDFLDDVGQYKGYRINDAEFDISSCLNSIQSILYKKNFIPASGIDNTIQKSRQNFLEFSQLFT